MNPNGAGKAAKPGDQELKEILEELTELEQNFCKVLTFNKGISQTQALIQAGSKATRKNATKAASEMLKREHVQRYLAYLEDIRAIESGIELDEVIANARKAIEMAFIAGKPRDAEPHNRLLAELGGFIKSGPQVQQNTQINNTVEESTLKGEAIDSDFRRLQEIAGISNED